MLCFLLLMQGVFPLRNDKADGWDGSSPVKHFPAQNDFGSYLISIFLNI